MTAGRLLLVEDDPALAGGLVRGLRGAGFEVELLNDGSTLVAAALRNQHDLIILDLMLPGASGLELLEQLQHRSSPPVIVLTARADLDDRLRSFALGAVDYVCKPFWIEELVARIRARLNRVPGAAEVESGARALHFGALTVQPDARLALLDGQDIKLTRTEYDLLLFLAQRPGRALSRSQIAQSVLLTLDATDARAVDAHVTRLRKKLGPCATLIGTSWGIGYRFDLPETT